MNPAKPAFAVGDRAIGPGHQPYVIAEIGVNHDGDLALGSRLVRAAREAGADAVKFQLFDAELLMSADARFAAYQEKLDAPDPRAMLRALELSTAAMGTLVAEAKSLGLHAIVTVFSEGLVEPAESMGASGYKSASPDIVHRPLLEAMARTGRPLIVSTGAASLEEVGRAAGWLAERRVAFLQCVSSYPTPDEHANLGAMAMIGAATGAVVGYSDHTTSVDSGGLAVAAGACILEKHLTYDRRAKGPDHAASLDPGQFAEYVRLARRAFAMLGGGKAVAPIEEDVRRVSRQSLVARRDLAAGSTIGAGDLTAKRPGTGIAPYRLAEILGRRLRAAVAADHVLRDEDLA